MANTNDLYRASFGQHGNAFQDTNAAVTPDTGMIICAISFLAETTLTAMSAADDDEVVANASFGLTAGEAGAGSGGVVITSSNKFPAGLTIYGRWSSVTPTADSAGGIICYFAPR
jgi:hypothetical protein